MRSSDRVKWIELIVIAATGGGKASSVKELMTTNCDSRGTKKMVLEIAGFTLSECKDSGR